MARSIEGHAIAGFDLYAAAYYLTRDHEPSLPAMCHGTTRSFVPSILCSGLSLSGRQSVMLSIVLHRDPRIGKGQRSDPNESSAVMFFNKDSAIAGDSVKGELLH